MSRSWTTVEDPATSRPTRRFGAPTEGWLAPKGILLLVTTTLSVAALLAVTSYEPDAVANPEPPVVSTRSPEVAGTQIERSDPDLPTKTFTIRCTGDEVVDVLIRHNGSTDPTRRITVCGPGVANR